MSAHPLAPTGADPDVPPPSLAILYPGSCEPLKAAFHGVALSLAAVMGLYNAAAWVRRRQSHLAINAIIYIAAVFWEQRHVIHHMEPCLTDPTAAAVRTEPNPPLEQQAA